MKRHLYRAEKENDESACSLQLPPDLFGRFRSPKAPRLACLRTAGSFRARGSPDCYPTLDHPMDLVLADEPVCQTSGWGGHHSHRGGRPLGDQMRLSTASSAAAATCSTSEGTVQLRQGDLVVNLGRRGHGQAIFGWVELKGAVVSFEQQLGTGAGPRGQQVLSIYSGRRVGDSLALIYGNEDVADKLTLHVFRLAIQRGLRIRTTDPFILQRWLPRHPVHYEHMEDGWKGCQLLAAATGLANAASKTGCMRVPGLAQDYMQL